MTGSLNGGTSDDPLRRRDRAGPQGNGSCPCRRDEPGRGRIEFAESVTPAVTLATLRAARAWAAERNEDNLAAARAHLEGGAAFPERAAQTLLVGRFLTDYYRLVAEWADWAAGLVERWPDDPRAEWSEGEHRPPGSGP
ncbi:hypothetical protein ACIHFC_16400 [Streptomyces sp. NPDC052013]|uniref:hypothetical protein n=1 Tax=Streptomyces sp. NPDC052013 TaxID=3365679 RepID=UPI0037D58CCE